MIVEAFQRLTGEDVVASHISDHYADLLPVSTAMAEELNVLNGIHESVSDDEMHNSPSRWVVLNKDGQLAMRLIFNRCSSSDVSVPLWSCHIAIPFGIFYLLGIRLSPRSSHVRFLRARDIPLGSR